MSFFEDIFSGPPCATEDKQEVSKLYKDLIRIGQKEGFLSERPGGAFNIQCRNTRAREIGQRMYSLGGVALMDYIMRKIRKPLGKELSSHLEYCWAETGTWLK